MGVRADIAAYAKTEEEARTAARAAFAAMNHLDAVLSDYRADSEAMVLCRKPAGTPVVVGSDLYMVLEQALEFSTASSGVFDVTVGPVVQLWREARRDGVLPQEAVLRAAQERVGWEKVTLKCDPSGVPTVTLAVEGMRLDFGGIGKGYAADRALQVLRSQGLRSCLVAMSGDIAIGDPPPGKPGWTVELTSGGSDDPVGERRSIVVSNCGVSTSGDTEQFVEIEGHRYSHIVDPRTGQALEDWQADTLATIVASDATTSDAVCKMVCVLPFNQGMATLGAGQPCEAYLRSRTGGREISTLGFPKFAVPSN